MEEDAEAPASNLPYLLDPDWPPDTAVVLYLRELQKEDIALNEAEHAMEKARFDFQLALRRYALVRDVVRERFAINPYLPEDIEAYADELEEMVDNQWFPTRGRFRFVHMPPGDAIVAALEEADEPLTLDELVALLRKGGMHVQDARTINAALRNTRDVQRLPDGRYAKTKPKGESADVS
jgi:hypothetical protein